MKKTEKTYLATYEVQINGSLVGKLCFDDNGAVRKTAVLIRKINKGERFAQLVILWIIREFKQENYFGSFKFNGNHIFYQEVGMK